VFAYAPADGPAAGFAVVSDRFVVLLSSDTSTDTVFAIHRLLDGTHGNAQTALELLADPATAERFALVEIIDSVNRTFEVTVRGEIVVDLGGASTSRFTWPRGTNWLRGEAFGVESLHLSFDAEPTATAGLPLRNGAVRASAISLGVTVATDLLEESMVGASPVAHAETATDDDISASQVDRRPLPVDLAAMMKVPAWTLTLPDGNELEAAPQIVVGRRPWRSDPDETQTYYIVAPSPQREISGKHMEFTVVGGELFARDLDSTNGTVIYTPHKPPRLLHEGNATSLAAGDALDLGDGFRIVVGTRR